MSKVLNVFEMYYENNTKAGYWLIRDSWKSIVARVVSIDGIKAGPLPNRLGKPPYFNHAKERVYAETYDVIRDDQGLLFKQTLPQFDTCPTDKTLSVISCPGTYGYRMLDLSKEQVRIQSLDGNIQPLISISLPINAEVKQIPTHDGHLLNPKQLAEIEALVGQYGNLIITYDRSKNAYQIQFSYDPKYVDCIKRIPASKRTYTPASKTWLLDISSGDTIRALIEMANSINKKT